MSLVNIILLTVFIIVELFYWGWYIPRHWRNNREASDFVAVIKYITRGSK